MPFTGISDPSLPSNVKKLPKKRRKAWVAIWNSVFKSCMKKSNDEKKCEGKAFAIANGMVKEGLTLQEILKILNNQ